MANNARLDLVTAEHVKRAARKRTPGNVQKWEVIVEGQEYAPRPLMMDAANLVQSTAPFLTPADYNTHRYVRRLKELDFKVNYYG